MMEGAELSIRLSMDQTAPVSPASTAQGRALLAGEQSKPRRRRALPEASQELQNEDEGGEGKDNPEEVESEPSTHRVDSLA